MQLMDINGLENDIIHTVCFQLMFQAFHVSICSTVEDPNLNNRHVFYTILGGGFNEFFFLNFHPYLGRWSNLTNIFQLGWNHQLVYKVGPYHV